jgi:hypothetical protein
MGFDEWVANRYAWAMRRDHRQIVQAVTDTVIAATLGLKAHQPRDWRLRNSIPPEYWDSFEALGWSTLAELAAAAADRKGVQRPDPADVSAATAA